MESENLIKEDIGIKELKLLQTMCQVDCQVAENSDLQHAEEYREYHEGLEKGHFRTTRQLEIQKLFDRYCQQSHRIARERELQDRINAFCQNYDI